MPLRERLVDFAAPERTFKKLINREIKVALEYFHASWIRGVSVTVGRAGREGRIGTAVDLVRGEQRGYFWETNGIRHIVGQETMNRKEEKALLELIHELTIPYGESKYWEKSDEQIFGKRKS
jgi:superfamily II DNA/RNA helicase